MVHCSRIGETRLSMVPVARIVQKLRKLHSPTRMAGSVKRLELLANFWQIALSRDIPRKGESENSRVFYLNGGPGWT
jgi:hypothetical protein